MKFNLRPWNTSDIDALCISADNAKIARYMTDRFPHPYSKEAGERFIAITTSKENANRFRVIEIDGAFAGGIGIHPQEDIFSLNAELAYWLDESYWNKGFATKAVVEMTEYGFRTFEITRIFARVFGSNKASARVLEKAGYSFEYTIEKSIIKNSDIEDCLIYGINKLGNTDL